MKISAQDMLALWRRGKDTATIAAYAGVQESVVYNKLMWHLHADAKPVHCAPAIPRDLLTRYPLAYIDEAIRTGMWRSRTKK